jgi:hypothetical protein
MVRRENIRYTVPLLRMQCLSMASDEKKTVSAVLSNFFVVIIS